MTEHFSSGNESKYYLILKLPSGLILKPNSSPHFHFKASYLVSTLSEVVFITHSCISHIGTTVPGFFKIEYLPQISPPGRDITACNTLIGLFL